MLKMIHIWSVFILVALFTPHTQAKLMCQQLFLQTGKDVEVKSQINIETPSELNLRARSFEGADPKTISEEVKDLVLMMSQARSLIISDKEVNEKGRLLLGLPIGNGFSLELKYKSNSTEENKFVLDHINLISPSGKQLDVSANPIDNYDDRKLSKDRVNFEIGTYPDGYNITAKIPTLIRGEVLKEIQALAPKLELVPKDVIRELAKESDLKVLKSKANRAYMKYFIKRYSIRGAFKTVFKLIVYEPLKMLITLGIVYTAAHTITGGLPSIQELISPKSNVEWVYSSLHNSAGATQVPAAVKQQLAQLETDLRGHQPGAIQSPDQLPIDQNASKLQTTKDQYLWTSTATDKATGKTSTLIFVSSDNKKGQVNYSAIVVDPVKYASLISYIKSVGQFIPVTDEDLK